MSAEIKLELEEEKLETLEKNETEIEKIQKEASEEKDKFLRIIANYENKIKRIQIDSLNKSSIIVSNLVSEIINIIDDLSNAYEIAGNDLKEGLDLIIKNMKKILMKYGVEEILPKSGELFNSEDHQAIATKESELEEGLILEVIKTGYKYQNKTIIPAIVITSI